MNFDLIALAPVALEDILRKELNTRVIEERGRLFLVRGKDPIYFAQNVWLAPKELKFNSISEGAKFLKGIQRNWALYSTGAHRRAKLVEEQLPPLKDKRIESYSKVPTSPLGAWTMWDENKIFYSATTTSPYKNGEHEFIEDKTGPPSRAYLKLWEHFLLTQKWPRKGETVLDLGSSPGGWTWALDQLGCEVISVDKAPLAEGLRLSRRVKLMSEDAFKLKPSAVGAVDWMFSDIICYPDKLFEMVELWRASGQVKNLVCTIKFQGETDFPTLKKFRNIPGAQIRHLYHNKHELMFSLSL